MRLLIGFPLSHWFVLVVKRSTIDLSTYWGKPIAQNSWYFSDSAYHINVQYLPHLRRTRFLIFLFSMYCQAFRSVYYGDNQQSSIPKSAEIAFCMLWTNLLTSRFCLRCTQRRVVCNCCRNGMEIPRKHQRRIGSQTKRYFFFHSWCHSVWFWRI